MVLGSGTEARMQGIRQVFEREGLGHPSSRPLEMEPLWIHSGCTSPVVGESPLEGWWFLQTPATPGLSATKLAARPAQVLRNTGLVGSVGMGPGPRCL